MFSFFLDEYSCEISVLGFTTASRKWFYSGRYALRAYRTSYDVIDYSKPAMCYYSNVFTRNVKTLLYGYAWSADVIRIAWAQDKGWILGLDKANQSVLYWSARTNQYEVKCCLIRFFYNVSVSIGRGGYTCYPKILTFAYFCVLQFVKKVYVFVN